MFILHLHTLPRTVLNITNIVTKYVRSFNDIFMFDAQGFVLVKYAKQGVSER